MTTSNWSPYDSTKVRAQQDAFMDLLRDRGAEIVILDPAPGCSCQHYPRDLGFVIDNVFVMARLNSEHRRPEASALAALTAGMPRVAYLPRGTIEGGDVMLHDGCVLVGLSEETSLSGVAGLQAILNALGVDREVIPIRFAVPGIVHLDDHFNIVAPRIALVHRAVFPPDQILWFEEHFDRLIEVTDDEACAVQANMLAISPGVVVAATGSDRICRALAAEGIEVLTVDYSAVTQIPGSLRCTTLPLLRI
ncbi:dimethylarginine dimethylaminohydrolase family protein [Parafrankia sp. CH37]|nr:arginine deiminase family protein [Parafrankia sp. CH37]